MGVESTLLSPVANQLYLHRDVTMQCNVAGQLVVGGAPYGPDSFEQKLELFPPRDSCQIPLLPEPRYAPSLSRLPSPALTCPHLSLTCLSQGTLPACPNCLGGSSLCAEGESMALRRGRPSVAEISQTACPGLQERPLGARPSQ